MLEIVNERKSAFGKKLDEIRMFNKNNQFSNFKFNSNPGANETYNSLKNSEKIEESNRGNVKNSNISSIIKSNEENNSNTKIVFNNSNQNLSNHYKLTNNQNDNSMLGKKQLAHKSIADMFNKSFDNTNQSTELIPRKIEFKLSHVLKGGEMEEVQKINKKDAGRNNNIDNIMYNINEFQLSVDKPIGFNNVGNTCFLNSVLQSLCSTKILVNYLFKNDHINTCQFSKQSVCILCQFHKLLLTINNSKSSSCTPMSIVQNIKVISKSIRIGRQEDSHEFLTKMLEMLESSNMKDLKLKDHNFIKNLNDTHKGVIYDIFGGEVNSTVTCGQCKHKSVKKEDFYSISLVRKIFIFLGFK